MTTGDEPSAVHREPLAVREHPGRTRYDAVVVGSGPNGLAAAITLARAGRSVVVIEAAPTIGGGLRTAELTLPGYRHDVCSAIHALAMVSPFFRSLPLEEYGVEWVHAEIPVAHPLADGAAAVGLRSVEETAARLAGDGEAYRRLMEPLVEGAERMLPHVLGPLRLPRHPLLMARFGWSAMRSAAGLANSRFRGEAARALFAGHAAHSVLPLEEPMTAAVGLMLGLSVHVGGWPMARGGSQALADAMARYLIELGGELVVCWPVASLEELPASTAVFLDVTPRQVIDIVGDELPLRYAQRLREFRYGPGVFKLDWALDGEIPWANEDCGKAATVHVGGTFDEVAASERAAWSGEPAERPFVLLAQSSVFDASRAPEGKHTVWGYCHVPHGCAVDMTERIEAQVERFAPGFRDRILARHAFSPQTLQDYNGNYIGGDITGGVMNGSQLFMRPVARWSPYTTPLKGVFLCSASTPPGGGVHGMCGVHAAEAAMRRCLR